MSEIKIESIYALKDSLIIPPKSFMFIGNTRCILFNRIGVNFILRLYCIFHLKYIEIHHVRVMDDETLFIQLKQYQNEHFPNGSK